MSGFPGCHYENTYYRVQGSGTSEPDSHSIKNPFAQIFVSIFNFHIYFKKVLVLFYLNISFTTLQQLIKSLFFSLHLKEEFNDIKLEGVL